MKITSYNIQFGRGLDLVIDIDRICDSISGGDIICLQEVDVGWDRSNKVTSHRQYQKDRMTITTFMDPALMWMTVIELKMAK